MNFKTTLVLIGLLAVAGIVLLVTRDSGTQSPETVAENQQKLFQADEADVNKLIVTAADGRTVALERAGGKWRMTQPVNAEAEAFEVDSLVRAVVDLQSQGTTDAQATGLDKPQYTIDFTTGDGKSHTLLVGEKTAVGDNLYVRKKDENVTQVVAAALLEKLEKQPADFRSKKLVEMSTNDVTRIEIDKPGGKIVLAKSGSDWKVTEPQQFAAEKADVDDILFQLTGLRAKEFVSENAKAEASQYDLEKARIVATLSTTRPALPAGVAAPTTASTAPAATQPAPLIVKFGRYDDVLKENVYVMTSQSPVIAAVGANVLEAINKKPIELRDRRVLDLEPAHASAITISSDLAATTQPTSRPASKKEVVLKRRKQGAAKPQETTAPATQVAATQAATQPATTQAAATQAVTQPATKWEVVTSAGESKDADDSKIDTLLSQLHPLRAQKYLETAPTTRPTATYVLKITTEGPGGTPVENHEIHLVDPGDFKPLIGTYNGLAFEVERSLVDRLSGDFLKGSAPAAGDLANDGLPDTFGQ